MADLNKLTQKSQEAIQQAQNLATRHGQQQIDADHLLHALLDQDSGLVPRLLERLQIPVAGLRDEVQRSIERKPKVGGAVEAGKIYVSQELQQALTRAEDEAKRLKDEYVSVAHLFLAFFELPASSPVGQVLRKFQLDRNRFLAVLQEVRGSQRVTSANPEAAYEALEK